MTAIAKVFGSDGFVGLPRLATGVIAIGIISGAYQAEVYGALRRRRAGAVRCGKSAGPVAVPNAAARDHSPTPAPRNPRSGNVWQLVLKTPTLISVIGLVELMRQSQIGAGSTREPFLFYIAAASLYFAIAGITARAASRRSLRRRPAPRGGIDSHR